MGRLCHGNYTLNKYYCASVILDSIDMVVPTPGSPCCSLTILRGDFENRSVNVWIGVKKNITGV